jgi:hypothetical protein
MQVRSSFVLSHHVEHNGENIILNKYHMNEKLFKSVDVMQNDVTDMLDGC